MRFALPLAMAFVVSMSASLANAADKPVPCAPTEFHQWDFWLGSWRVTDPDGKYQGSNVISAAPGGCGLVEHWTGAEGNEGTSLNAYDARRETWTQFWVSPGVVIRLEGKMRDGAMTLEGTISYNKTRVEHPFRGIWTPQGDGSVKQEFFEQDPDTQKWSNWFTGIYRRT